MKLVRNLVSKSILVLLLPGLAVLLWGALPPTTGGTLAIRMPGPLDLLDPAHAESPAERQVAALVAEPLFSPGANETAGDLLSMRHEMNEGRMRLRVWLKPGLRFHDGSLLRSEDVKASYERLLRLSAYAEAAEILEIVSGAASCREGRSGLTGFEVLSPVEFVIRLERPEPSFAFALSRPDMAVIPARQARQSHAVASPIGTGPFRIGDRSPRFVELRRFEDYHGGPAYLSALRIQRTDSIDDETESLRLGKAHLVAYGRREAGRSARSAVGVFTGLRISIPSGGDGNLARAFWSRLVDCRDAVKLFEPRQRAPFVDESKPQAVFGTVKAADEKTRAWLTLLADGAGSSCASFRPDAEEALRIASRLEALKRPVLRVREDERELRRIAERIAVRAREAKLAMDVRVLSSVEWAHRSPDGWSAELGHYLPNPSPDVLPKNNVLPLARLYPSLAGSTERVVGLRAGPYGLFSFDDAWERRP